MAIEQSGFYYPNKMGHIYAHSIEKTIGPAAMEKLYELAAIPAEYCPPPNNLAKEFDFAYFSAYNNALFQMYGERGERAISTQAGREAFIKGLTAYGSFTGVTDFALKPLSIGIKVKLGLQAMAETMTKLSDQKTTIVDAGDYMAYTLHRCPICWGRQSEKPICYAAKAMIEAALDWLTNGAKFQIEEVECRGLGAEGCVFHVAKQPLPSPE